MRFKSNLETYTEHLDLRCGYEPYILPNTKTGAAKDYGKTTLISDLLLSAIFCVIVYSFKYKLHTALDRNERFQSYCCLPDMKIRLLMMFAAK